MPYISSLVNPSLPDVHYQWWIDSTNASDSDKCLTVSKEGTITEHACKEEPQLQGILHKPLCQLGTKKINDFKDNEIINVRSEM